MPRLRTTSGLSLLALLIGVAGTSWLSTLTDQWSGPPARFVGATVASSAARTTHPSRQLRAPAHVVQHRALAVSRTTTDAAGAQAAVVSPTLVPLSMPADTTQPWYRLRGHLDGRLRVHVEVDAGGRVQAARVTESSGDPVLDAHALRSVSGWRFAIPADHPAGLSGELPMRFSSQGNRIAQVR